MSKVAPPAIPNANPAPPPIPGVAPPKPRVARSPVPRKQNPEQPAVEPDEEYEPSTFERLAAVMSTSFGISMLAHILVLMILGFLYITEPKLEELQIVSGISETKPVEHLERIDMGKAPLPVKKKITQTTRTLAIPITKSGPTGAMVLNVPAPEIGSPNPSNGPGGSGGKLFGSAKEANSFVFVVDCSGSMTGPRFNRAISELIRTINDLKSTQRFYVIFYASGTIPLFTEPTLTNLNTMPAMGNPLAGQNPAGQPGPQGKATKRKPKVRRAPVRIINGRAVQGKLRTKKGAKNDEVDPQRILTGQARRLIPATDTYKVLAQRWIHKLRAGGGTQPSNALEIALQMEPEVIYFLTDGQIPIDTPDVIKRANKSKVRVNTVALGFAGSESLLRRIASENKGTYKFVR